ncbi:MAG: hypothetical protein ACI4EQ_04610 [Lachnospiraceae bacterium]
MKLKYYLRGLGIGILVTIVIVAISGAGKKTMTDEEIKNRARELGMVESTVLSDIQNKEPEGTETPKPSTEPEGTETPKPSTEPEGTETPKPSTEPEGTETPKPTEEPEKTETPKPSIEPEETETPKPSIEPEKTPIAEASDRETITIVISNGESSVTVSKTLEAMGLIENASDYDKYLCENGYDKKIRTGTYEVPTDASEEEIAKIITRSK